jgi:endonuclease/exonuclease/phosphatase family metal-dependent hydrolase
VSGGAISLVTWNVHHCRGLDGRVVPERIARTLEALEPDLVALQELDVGRARTHRVDQPAWLAARLAMTHVFYETCEGYGHALLSRLPIERVERVLLPTPSGSEPRAALDVTVRASTSVRVLSTHLSLSAPDRTAQARALSARTEEASGAIVVLGDLNAGPRELGYEDLLPALSDPLAGLPLRARCTWPSLWPVRALDHVLLSSALRIRDARVCDRGAARFASDHLPVRVDVEVATS